MLICNDEPDIILLTEVIPKAQKLPISPALLHVPGFSMYANFSPSTPNLGSSGTRGVCIYVANHLSASEVSLNASTVEHTWVRLSLKGSDCLLIGCIYRSPSSRLEDGVHQLRLLFQQATSLCSHVLMVGDFNFPQIDWDVEASQAPDSHCSHSFLEAIRDHFLFQHVKCPICYRPEETPNVLDLIFTNEEGMVSNLEYLPGLGNSDHVVLQFSLICYSGISSNTPPTPMYTNYGLVAEALMSCDWTPMANMDLEDAYEFFKGRITDAVAKCSKARKARRKKNLYINRKAWQLKKRKKSLWGAFCCTSDPLDYARFARCKNELRGLTRKLRKEHERRLVTSTKQNPFQSPSGSMPAPDSTPEVKLLICGIAMENWPQLTRQRLIFYVSSSAASSQRRTLMPSPQFHALLMESCWMT